MAKIYYEKNEPYSAQQMFDLVNKIDDYPLFVPDCTQAGILTQQESELTAFIEIAKFGFKKKFSTRNQLQSPTEIKINLLKGPFKHLNGVWRFQSLSESSCHISFGLEFEFDNRLLEMAFSAIFKDIMHNMVKAFSARAQAVYQDKTV